MWLKQCLQRKTKINLSIKVKPYAMMIIKSYCSSDFFVSVKKIQFANAVFHLRWGFFAKSSYGGPYHIEISPLICSANQWTGFYMIGTIVMKELMVKSSRQKFGLRVFPENPSTPLFKILVRNQQQKHYQEILNMFKVSTVNTSW